MKMKKKTETNVNKYTEKHMEDRDFQKIANRVSFITIAGNIVLSVFKLLAGIIAHSGAMISDAVHSASDVFSTVVVITGIRLASKEPDKEHPYGHERMECVTALILSMILFVTGLGIGVNAVKDIFIADSVSLEVPGVLALAAALLSIAAKEGMYQYTKHYARKINSDALMADAWHHRSDALSSVGALIGIAGARMGFPVMDPVASLVIFIFVAKAAFEIFKDAAGKMVDRSCSEETEQLLRQCIMKNKNVTGIDLLYTRVFGNKIYVDAEISADPSFTLREAHGIAEEVHDDIEANFPKVKHVMVHVNPAPASEVDTVDAKGI